MEQESCTDNDLDLPGTKRKVELFTGIGNEPPSENSDAAEQPKKAKIEHEICDAMTLKIPVNDPADKTIDICEPFKPSEVPNTHDVEIKAKSQLTEKHSTCSDPDKGLTIGKLSTEDLQQRQLLPRPYFYYRDFSASVDEDPLIPLTPLARLPNFPAKMHSILARSDFLDVVSWMPHGRSWRVLKPREFEIRVIPAFFEHQKFSSFIRQANGWGFRRITQGRDRNSYYHELFLRGLPHLCKKMKRPGVSKKTTMDAQYEPDFYAISEMYPLPTDSTTDNVVNDVNVLLPSSLGLTHNLNEINAQNQLPTLGAAPNISNMKSLVSMLNSGQHTPMPDVNSSNAAVLNAALISNSPLVAHPNTHNFPSLNPMQKAISSLNANGSTMNPCAQIASQQMSTAAIVAAALNSPGTPPGTNPSAQDIASLLQRQPQSLPQILSLAADQQRAREIQRALAIQALLTGPRPAGNLGGISANATNDLKPQNPTSSMSVTGLEGASTQFSAGFPSSSTPMADASSQFAAGFAAATALNNSQIRQAVNEALASHTGFSPPPQQQCQQLPGKLEQKEEQVNGATDGKGNMFYGRNYFPR